MKPALTFERIVDLYEGMALYKVDLELCREQDKNARVMSKATLERLEHTIGRDKRLESIPYGYVEANPTGNKQFAIISGHHRTRAARAAGVHEIFVIADETELSPDQIKAKQLAHNALSGYDDEQMLKEIYDSIQDVDAKIDSGIMEAELDKNAFRSVTMEEVSLDFDYKSMKFMFLPSQLKKFDAVADELMKEDTVRIGSMEDFDKMTETIRELSKVEDIRNLASIIDRMCDIVLDYVKLAKIEKENDELSGKIKLKPKGKQPPRLNMSEN